MMLDEERAKYVNRELKYEQEIESLRQKLAEAHACINLLYSWANNWDSEFMDDPEWRDKDFPRIQAAMKEQEK